VSARRERGFSLSELMVTIAIVGVLTVLGFSLLRTSPRPVDVASQVSSKLAEASRKAITLGAVRGDVAAALGSKARTRAVFVAATTGVSLTVEMLAEAPAPATTASWIELTSVSLDRDTILSGYTPAAVLAEGGTPAIAVGASGTFEMRCYPDGTSVGMTIYLASRNGARRARVVILPLGGTPMTFHRW
jgi:prepilin-type N-terminal cleavage/methylation domain-containing protein